MGKKLLKSEEELTDMMLPVANDVMGTVTKMFDSERIWWRARNNVDLLKVTWGCGC